MGPRRSAACSGASSVLRNRLPSRPLSRVAYEPSTVKGHACPRCVPPRRAHGAAYRTALAALSSPGPRLVGLAPWGCPERPRLWGRSKSVTFANRRW